MSRIFTVPRLSTRKISRLDVAMNNAFAMGILQPLRGLQNDIQCRFHVERPVLAQQRVQIAPFDEFHHQVMNSVLFAGIEGGDDVWMTEPRGGLHFARETPHVIGSHDRTRRKHFQGHGAAHALMLSPVHLPHSTGANSAKDQILPEHFDFLHPRRRLYRCGYSR